MVIFYHLYLLAVILQRRPFPATSKFFCVSLGIHGCCYHCSFILLLLDTHIIPIWLVKSPSSWVLCLFHRSPSSQLSGIRRCSGFTLYFLFCSALESAISPRNHDSFQWRMGFRNQNQGVLIAIGVSLLLGLFNR